MLVEFQDGVRLETSRSGPVLRRDGVPVEHPLQVGEALALVWLDALGDERHATRALTACLPEGAGTAGELMRYVVQRFHTYLERRRSPERVVALQWLEALSSCVPRPVRLAAPQAVTWLVTLACNRRCPYCWYNVTHHAVDAAKDPVDATLSNERAMAMVREMGAIGAADLYLTGGEPLLRRDLVEVMAEAARGRVRCHLVTKYPIDKQLAQRLAEARAHEVTFSLDDSRALQAAALAGGERAFLSEAQTAIEALLSASIPVVVNAVITRVNQNALQQLARSLVEMGVERLTLGHYSPPHHRPRGGLNLVPERLTFPTTIARLQGEFGDRIEIEASGSALPSSKPCGRQLACDVGTLALDVLPDGAVTRCRYLPKVEGLWVGSLADSSILDIWNGEQLAALAAPDRGEYAGTSCGTCSAFDDCNARGRCFATARTSNGGLYGPDAFCHVAG